MNRRGFLKAMLGAAAVAGTVSYFDMGPSWQINDRIWTPDKQRIHLEFDEYIPFLKQYYNDRVVASLTYSPRMQALHEQLRNIRV